MHQAKLLKAILPALLLAGCAATPKYKFPESARERAFLKLNYSESSILSGAIKVTRTQGALTCNMPLPNPETLFVLSRGNPLISDFNASGAWIPAGARFSFTAMSLRDGWPACGRSASFTPKNGGSYELLVTHHGSPPSAYDRHSTAGVTCKVEVNEVIPEGNNSMSRPVEDFRLEGCVQGGGTN